MRLSPIPFALLLLACGTNTPEQQGQAAPPAAAADTVQLIHPNERHFKSLRQLSNGGDIAEAYWSFDGTRLVFQATVPEWGDACDQIFVFNPFQEDLLGAPPQRISIHGGRTTCSYFMPGDTTVIFASTHQRDAACPHVPERRADGKYVWPIYDSFDIYEADMQGNIVGVIVSKLNAQRIAQTTGDIAQNVNFAVQGMTALAFARRAGINPQLAQSLGRELSTADVGDVAHRSTLLIRCER
jgi:hypothetical protein